MIGPTSPEWALLEKPQGCELPPSILENGGGDVWAPRLHGDLGACDSMLLAQPDFDDR